MTQSERFEAHATRLRSRRERHVLGKAARAAIPRETHADFTIDVFRDPLAVLTRTDPLRVSSLVPERYRRMAASPFAFLRGAAALMAADLATMPRLGLPVQACGDCHLMNFGAFSSPEGNILFDINDFDETLPGVDFMIDLKRLVASVAVAAQTAGLSDAKAHKMAAATTKAYRDFMSDLATRSPLAIWQTRMDLADQLDGLGDADLETELLDKLVKAEHKGRQGPEQPGIDINDDGSAHFIEHPPFVAHEMSGAEPINSILSAQALEFYKNSLLPERARLLHRYQLVDAAYKVVGVGSVGTRCAIALMRTADGETLVLQMKQALASCLAAPDGPATQLVHQGQRVVEGQRALQAASDIFLGWTQDGAGRHFYLRQLKNRRLSSIGDVIQSKALPAYATLCGRTLARAHARTGDPVAITGYVGNSTVLDQALASFAMSYASQTVLDHAKLVASDLPGTPPTVAA